MVGHGHIYICGLLHVKYKKNNPKFDKIWGTRARTDISHNQYSWEEGKQADMGKS